MGKLKIYGLNLRSDSTVCQDYINSRRDDIDEVVEIMREMHFFFTHTRYPQIIKKAYDAHFRNRNTYYDEYSDDSFDSDDSHESLDRTGKSHNAKVNAMIHFCARIKKKKHITPNLIIPKNALAYMEEDFISTYVKEDKEKNSFLLHFEITSHIPSIQVSTASSIPSTSSTSRQS